MKDKLEQFIEKNREAFDSFDPPGPERIIQGKRKPYLPTRSLHSFTWYFSRAAAVLLIFALSYVFHDFVDKGKEKRLTAEKEADVYHQIPELREAENYYANLVSGKLEEMRPFLLSNPGIQEDIIVDMQELDSIYNSLKEDLRDNVANDQIIEAMIQNYRLKLRILEDLQAMIKNENDKDYETKNTSI